MIEIQQYHVENFFRRENITTGGMLLDVGAGAQKPFTSAFINLFGQENLVVALDQNFWHPNYRGQKAGLMVAANGLRLSFADNLFRWASLGWVLDICTGKPQLLLSEVYRVLQVGGTLVGDVWLRSVPSDPNNIDQNLGRRLLADADNYKQMLQSSGFVVNEDLSFFGKRIGEPGREISWCFIGDKRV